MPGHRVEVIDTVGAGDTFIATILSIVWTNLAARPQWRIADLGRADLRALGERAAAAAAITCSRQGADPPTTEELAALA